MRCNMLYVHDETSQNLFEATDHIDIVLQRSINHHYLKLISKLLEKKYKLFINFSPRNKEKFNLVLNKFKNKSNIVFTYKKDFNKVLQIIQKCNYMVGNESGPICVGASLRKKVLSIYNPITTPKSSKTIYKKVKFINSRNTNSKTIHNKILKFLN